MCCTPRASRRSAVGNGSLEIDGVPADRLGELAARHQLVLHELSPQQASLEEAFMQLTAESVEYHAHDGEPVPARPAGAGRRRREHRSRPGHAGGAADGWGADWQKKRS